VTELIEKVYDRYWRIEESGDVKRMKDFISMLETSINPIISQFKNK
jgi:hypothetical protein